MSQMPLFAHNPITKTNEQIEYRMSNKEFRMTKFCEFVFSFDLCYSSFDILRFAFDSLRKKQRSHTKKLRMLTNFAF